MKVSELIELLKGHNQDNEVIISSDAEGNDYSIFEDIADDDLYFWDKENDELIYKEDYSIEEIIEMKNELTDCIILYP